MRLALLLTVDLRLETSFIIDLLGASQPVTFYLKAEGLVDVHVDLSIDLATKLRDDHNVVAAFFDRLPLAIGERRKQLSGHQACRCASGTNNSHASSQAFSVSSAFQQAKKHVEFDSNSIRDPWYQEMFREKISRVPIFGGTRQTADHAEACRALDHAAEDLSEQILFAAVNTFPVQKASPAKSWISNQTWTCIQQCNLVRSSIRRLRVHRKNCMQSALFMMWLAISRVSGKQSLVCVASVSRAVSLWEAKIPSLDWWIVSYGHFLYTFCALKLPLLLGDKRLSMQRYAAEAQKNAHDAKKLYSIVRSLAGMSSKLLDGIDDADGHPAVE